MDEYYYQLEYNEGYYAGSHGLPLKDSASWIYEEGYDKALDDLQNNPA